jgi:hypothetical protein
LASVNLPKHVRTKRLASGVVAYYWELPPWARDKEGCPVVGQSLKGDLLAIIARANDLNASLALFRKGKVEGGPAIGTVDWLICWFERHPKFTSKAEGTQDDYSAGLRLVADHRLDVDGNPAAGQRIGNHQASAVRPYHADAIYLRLLKSPPRDQGGRAPGPTRPATVNAAMRAVRRMWNVALRDNVREQIRLELNPFTKMELEATESSTVPATREQLVKFINKADELGLPSMGTAALITYELIQREVDVIGRLSWADLEQRRIRVLHHKTKKMVWIPLYDGNGEPFFPEMIARLQVASRRGTLIVMRDQPDRRKKVHLPYKADYFRHVFREIADAAELPREFTFLGCRTGGMTELGDVEATDQEISALSTRSRATITVYTKETQRQVTNALRKRRDSRLGNRK